MEGDECCASIARHKNSPSDNPSFLICNPTLGLLPVHTVNRISMGHSNICKEHTVLLKTFHTGLTTYILHDWVYTTPLQSSGTISSTTVIYYLQLSVHYECQPHICSLVGSNPIVCTLTEFGSIFNWRYERERAEDTHRGTISAFSLAKRNNYIFQSRLSLDVFFNFNSRWSRQCHNLLTTNIKYREQRSRFH